MRDITGITKCRERAKNSVWWPGLSEEIQDLVQQYRVCALHKEKKPEPLIATPLLDTLLLISKRARHMMDARQILRILAHRKGKLKSKELNHI